MRRRLRAHVLTYAAALLVAAAAFPVLGPSQLAGGVAHAQPQASAPLVTGPPGFAMAEPATGSQSTASPNAASPINATYTHTPPANPSQDLPPLHGPIMPSTVIYYDFWLPSGDHYESDSTGDTNYENLLIRWANDVGSTQYHNLVTQYFGTNGTVGNSVSFGGSWSDTTTAYPHAGTTGDPLQDSDIQAEVHNAVTTNGWTEDATHIVAVFTATGIQECMNSTCTFSTSNGFCAYHDHFADGSTDALYAFMGFDNFTHLAGKTCVAGQTASDKDPNRSHYPNGDVSADAEVNTLSHEITEAETDPHPNATWTGPNGEIGDACNFNFTPRNDTGADVYLNGHPYIVQQEWSNAAHTCAIDLSTNGFCSGSVSKVCRPVITFGKTVDNAHPRVTSSIHYTLTVDNTSDSGVETHVVVLDTVPTGYVVTGVSAPSSTSSGFTSTSVGVGYDTLAVHQQRTVIVTATVPLQAGLGAFNCGEEGGGDLLGTALTGQISLPCAITDPVKIPTTLLYTGPSGGDYNDPATLSATLTDDTGNPLSGKTLLFTLNATETCSGVTNLAGHTSCSVTPAEAAGSYTVTAAFTDATDPKYSTSSTSEPFAVTREETTTIYTGPIVILQGGSGVTLSGQLLEDDLTPISGRTLTLGIGSQSCATPATDSSGSASCSIVFTGATGPVPLSATFAGDAYYVPSADTSQAAIVFGFPAGGAFTLGDKTVAAAGPSTTVTWWADGWNQLNRLSGGRAPASFKGFSDGIGLPVSTPPSTCASDWTTGPGDSPPPAASVPEYMGVVVTGDVSKSGSTISGTGLHIVVVKVDPGYAPDPADYGTGTIVAVYC